MNFTPTHQDSRSVLIVDDDRFMRTQLCCMLEQEGYQVIQASNGEEAIAAYTRKRPDIVLLDAIMPVMDGFTCCSKLRELASSNMPSGTPVLMITSLEDKASVDRAFESGATDYVTKPIHWAVLRQRVHRLVQASRANEELRHQHERERLMGAIATRIRQSLNLEEILNTTVTEVRHFLQIDRAIVYRFESDWSGVVAVESVDPAWISILGKTIHDLCFAKSYVQDYKQGYIKAVEDIYTAGFAPCHVDLLAQFQIRANLVVPILQGENLWGLLIAHHCSAPRQWHQFEIDLLENLAGQLAIALQQSELYQQLAKLNTNLELQVEERTAQLQQSLKFEAMLKRITDKVRDSLDESNILQTAVQELAIVLGVEYCHTALYDLDAATSTICYEYATLTPSFQGRVVQIANFPEIYSELLQGHYLQFCKIVSARLDGNYERLATLACPIFDDRGVLGDLWLVTNKEYVFNELEIRLIQQVANQCAIAIRQARLYQAAQAQVKEMEKINVLKDDFLMTVSHELKTPLSNMKMALQMLESINEECGSCSRIGNVNAESSPRAIYLDLLNDECERELKLIDDLLDLQQLNVAAQDLDKTLINLQDWIPHVVEPFEYQAQNHQQLLQIDIAPELPGLISDSYILARILTELLNNACKYTPPEEQITVSARTKAGIIQLSVSNSGVEIPVTEIPRIFDKFYRIPSNDPWKHGGTGLGLALVQKLVAYLGGSIQVKSKSKETCFIVELPIN